MIEARRLLAVLLVLVVGAGVVACGSDSDSDSGSDSTSAASAIEGETWTLMNIAAQGSASSLPNTVEAPTLEFDDGEVQVFTGCNSGSGTAEISESTIDFGPIALTKKGCPGVPSQVEGYVSRVLQGQVDYEVNQGNLVIEGKQYSLIFAPAKS